MFTFSVLAVVTTAASWAAAPFVSMAVRGTVDERSWDGAAR